MRYVVDGDIVLSHALEGPCATHIEEFARWARDQGYARGTRYRQVLLATGLSRWLGHQAISARHVTGEHVARYLRSRRRRVKIQHGDTASLKQCLEWLQHAGIVPPETVQRLCLSPVEREAKAFETYLQSERALATATIAYYVPFTRSFLADRFGTGPVVPSRLSASDVVRHVQRHAPRLHASWAKQLTTALRAYLRYARYRGALAEDLAAAVPCIANWSQPAIPRAIPLESVHRVLASINRRTPRGQRDYAIVLLLARLGLRASEVAFLDLDDLDWGAGVVTVRGKRNGRAALPVPVDVGEAIATYLRQGRPRSTCRRVFLRMHAPCVGFRGPSAISCVVRDALERAGVQGPTKGAHQFRHALATQMLRGGASLGEIGEILRHRTPETTAHYARVDLDTLRTLALPWPGGAR